MRTPRAASRETSSARPTGPSPAMIDEISVRARPRGVVQPELLAPPAPAARLTGAKSSRSQPRSRGDQVQGAAHQPGAGQLAAGQRPVDVGHAQPAGARPHGEPGRGEGLCLDPHDPLDRVEHACRGRPASS